MKKVIAVFAIVFSGYQSVFAQQTEVASDCSVTYNVSVADPKADLKAIQSIEDATKIVYIKGTRIRSDLLAKGYSQSTFLNSKSDTVIILKEIGSAKYITYLVGEKRIKQGEKYEGIAFNDTGEKKTILGYECRKVTAKLNDGTTYTAFYTPFIIPSNNRFEFQFKELPGLVLEYEEEMGNGKAKIKYTASKISFLPVPVAMFDIATTGYRVL